MAGRLNQVQKADGERLMTDHPLTDHICDQIQDSVHPCDPENMRSAADWQLEQVIEWFGECDDYELASWEQHVKMISDLKEAMRPTIQEDN